MSQTIAQLMLSEALPEDIQGQLGNLGTLDKKNLQKLFTLIANLHPDKYKDIAQKLSNLGIQVAESSGSSFSLKDLTVPPKTKALIDTLKLQVSKIQDNPVLPQDLKEKQIINLVGDQVDPIEKSLIEETHGLNNQFTEQLLSGTRGKNAQLRSLLVGDMLMTDHRDRVLPVPVLNGYAQGVKTHEYWAGAYGARRGTVSTKKATAQSGFFGKQLVQAAHDLVVTAKDCGTSSGLPIAADDPDNVGSVLARDYGPYKADTPITPAMSKGLAKYKTILIHSPITCGMPNGVCAKCVGIREKGHLPDIGENVGVPAAQAISEPMSQGALCLAENTLVRMADLSIKEIEKIEPGEYVLGAEWHGHTLPVKVLNRFSNGLKPCIKTEFNNIILKSTVDHKIATLEGVIALNCFSTITSVILVDEKTCYPITGQENVGLLPTYDLEVDHPDHLFVLANGLIVSNSEKHLGGALSKGGRSLGGFAAVNQMVQVPESFQFKAIPAELDGVVSSITEAPQGGSYIKIGEQEHYVPPEMKINTKVGDRVEAGDVLTEGTSSPADMARLRGVGEARRQFVQDFTKTVRDNGVSVNRRNAELIARGLINHVQITDPDGPSDALPDDIIEYDRVARDYQPRFGFKTMKPSGAHNMYLEKPALHYTIGTRVTKRVAKELQDQGINEVTVHSDTPSFQSHMVRAMEHALKSDDWQTRLSGSYLEKGLLEGVHRGRVSNPHSTSYVPGLAAGTEFGKDLKTTGLY